MANKEIRTNNRIGFFSLLTILFIGLKLTGYIDWSWLLVLLPMLLGVIMSIILVVIAATLLVLGNK